MWFLRDVHQRTRELFSEYLDGRLNDVTNARVAAHAQSCAECRTALAALEATVAQLREMPEASLPRSFRLAAHQVRQPALAGRSPTAGRPPGNNAEYGILPWLRLASSSAALLLVIVIAVDVLSTSPLAAGLAGQQFSPQASGQKATDEAAANLRQDPVRGIAPALPTAGAGATAPSPQASPSKPEALPVQAAPVPQQPPLRPLELALLCIVAALIGVTVAFTLAKRKESE